MSNYTKSTNFATKDNLTPGDPLKVVRGTEIDTEYNNIATAIATKTDNASAAITGGTITGITDLAVADGGTGASTAAGGLNNLLPAQTGNANKYLQTDGTNATWDAVTLSTADITGTLPVANGGTGVTASTGTGSVVLSNSPTLVTPALGTPSALVGTNITGTASGLTAGNVTTNANLTGAITSTGNATSLGSFSSANLLGALTDETGTGSAVFATSPTLVTPILGTPTSATLTNATGLPISTGVSGLGSGVATFLATPSSANLAAALTDETGSGANVFATSPTLVTPILGTPTSATLTNATGLPLTTGVTGTLPTANGGTNLTSFTSGGVVYASSTSALATGSALQFTGSAILLNTATSNIQLTTTVNTNQAQILLADADGRTAVFRGPNSGSPNCAQIGTSTSHDTAFLYNNTEQMRLTSTGLGIGTTSPQFGIDLRRGSGANAYLLAAGNNNGTTAGLLVGQDTTGLSLIWQYGANPITFWTNSTERARIPSTGGIQSVNSISVGNATPSANGAGITFPATQSASSDANTLDDYEEGTWTPSVGTQTVVGTFASSGTYTKIGRQVTVYATATGTTSISGTAGTYLGNLPFTPAATFAGGVGTNDGGNFVRFFGLAPATDGNIYVISGYAAVSGIYFSATYYV